MELKNFVQQTQCSLRQREVAKSITHRGTKIQDLLAGLKACSRTRNLEKGKQVHEVAVQLKHDSSIYLANALISMYGKCGSMLDARQVFDKLNHPSIVSWSALILGYADNGQGLAALNLFTFMKAAPNSITFVAAVKACRSLGYIDAGKALHNFAVENDCIDVYLQSTLVDMYAKYGSMADAREVFDSMKYRDVVSWNTLILGYAGNGQGYTALKLFTRMIIEGTDPDSVTFVGALKACTWTALAWVRGKAIYTLATQIGCNLDNYVIDLYAKCGRMADARQVFDKMKDKTVVSWNVLILGYADDGQGPASLQLFTAMRSGGTAPNPVTFVAALKACTTFTEWAKCRILGKVLHNLCSENGCDSDVYVQSTLVDMYAKSGCTGYACEIFSIMKHPDVVSWNALILGYAENGQAYTALELFSRLKTQGPSPTSVTFMVTLKACGLIGELEFGRRVHSGMDSLDVVLVTCLVDFYAKCGSLVEAQSVFNLHAEIRDTTTWNALLAGYSSCGNSNAVFKLFEEMQDAGFRSDGITFLCILTCCNRAGLLEKGKECFDEMPTKYRIIPTVQHYTCMIDIFGRAKKFGDVMALLGRMPCGPNDVTWMTVLDACRKWKNVELGRWALHRLQELRK